MLTITIVTTILAMIISKGTQKSKYKESLYNDERIKLIADTIVGIKTIKCFNRESKYE